MIQDLASAIRNKDVILFVGSGVPKNLGLPVYSELINQMADNLGYDPKQFNHGEMVIFLLWLNIIFSKRNFRCSKKLDGSIVASYGY